MHINVILTFSDLYFIYIKTSLLVKHFHLMFIIFFINIINKKLDAIKYTPMK